MNRPEIAQAIRDAALSWPIEYLGTVESIMLTRVFLWGTEWLTLTSGPRSFNEWLYSAEGRTYMLFVSEALS